MVDFVELFKPLTLSWRRTCCSSLMRSSRSVSACRSASFSDKASCSLEKEFSWKLMRGESGNYKDGGRRCHSKQLL